MSFIDYIKLSIRLALLLIAVFILLNISLVVLDYPKIEAYPAPLVKNLRYPERYNVFKTEGFSRYYINSYGLVGNEPAPLSDPSVYRIAVFGDSLVQAVQVPNEYKFTYLLERNLKPPPPFKKTEVWNFGYPGDNTGTAFSRWLHQAKALPFNLIIFTVNDNDLLENRPNEPDAPNNAFLIEDPKNNSFTVDYSQVNQTPNKWGLLLRETFSRFFYSTHIMRTRVTDYLSEVNSSRDMLIQKVTAQTRGPNKSIKEKNERESLPDEVIALSYRQLQFVHQQIRAAGKPVIILSLPTAYTMPKSFYAHVPLRQNSYLSLANYLKQSGIPYIDPYPALARYTTTGYDPYGSWESGGHLNRDGHALVAKTILEYMAVDTNRKMIGTQ